MPSGNHGLKELTSDQLSTIVLSASPTNATKQKKGLLLTQTTNTMCNPPIIVIYDLHVFRGVGFMHAGMHVGVTVSLEVAAVLVQ